MADEGSTIIIKKIKKGGHGAHGGAWKVAYADFVTAMMAFFLLLWLLASTSDAQKAGIADYFTPTVGLKDQMGIGVKGGHSANVDGRKATDKSPPGVMIGAPPVGATPQAPQDEKALIDEAQEAQLFEKAQKEIQQALESDPNFREFQDQILFEQTPEGMKITLRDSDKISMFEADKAILTIQGEKLIRLLTGVVRKLPNRIGITGHTGPDNRQSANPTHYSTWELSADRANAARRFMLVANLENNRIGRVMGRADQELLLPKTPDAAGNRRIEILMLKGSHVKMPEGFESAPRQLMSTKPAEEVVDVITQEKSAESASKPAAIPSETDAEKTKAE